MSSSVLSGFKNTRRSRVVLDPIKHVLRAEKRALRQFKVMMLL